MAAKKNRISIRLVSTADTGYFYVTEVNPKNTTTKLQLKRFDPRAIHPKTGKRGAHVMFKQSKIG